MAQFSPFGIDPLDAAIEEDRQKRGFAVGLGQTRPATGSPNAPRGLRNNNPLNIEAGPFAARSPGFVGSDGRFAQFDSPEAGMAAADRLLGVYGRQGISSIGGIIRKWAPAGDHNDVEAYSSFVANKFGATPDDPIDLSDPGTRRAIAGAMAEFENGGPVAAVSAAPAKGGDQQYEQDSEGNLIMPRAEAEKRQAAYLKEHPEPTVGGNLKEFAKGTIPGAASLIGSGVAGLANFDPIEMIATDVEKLAPMMRRIPDMNDQEFAGVMGTIDKLPALTQRFVRRVAKDLRSGEMTVAELEKIHPTPVAERPLTKAGAAIEDWSKKIMPAVPGYEDSWGRQFGEATGSLLGGIAATMVNPTLAGVLFTTSGSREAQQRAQQAGATPEQQLVAGIMGAVPGATDVLPVEILLHRVPLPVRRALGRVIARIGIQGIVEGVQEGGQQVLQNWIAQEVHTPSQSLTEGVLPNTAVGGGVGVLAESFAQIALGLATGRRGRAQRLRAPGASEAAEPAGAPPAAVAGPPPVDSGPLGRALQHGEATAQQTVAAMPPPPNAPPIGANVRVQADGVEPFEGKVDSYAAGEVIVADQNGEVFQVPVETLSVTDQPAPAPSPAPAEPAQKPASATIMQGLKAAGHTYAEIGAMGPDKAAALYAEIKDKSEPAAAVEQPAEAKPAPAASEGKQKALADEIEALSAKKRTAYQIFAELKPRLAEAVGPGRDAATAFIKKVRTDRGIPSQAEAEAFEKWVEGRGKEAAPAAEAAKPDTVPTFGEEGRLLLGPTSKEAKAFRAAHGHDAYNAAAAAQMRGETPTLAEAIAAGAALRAERDARREHAFSPEGQAEAERQNREKAEAEQNEKNDAFAKAGGETIEPGDYVNVGTELPFTVEKAKDGTLTIWTKEADGGRNIYGTTRGNKVDANALAFALWVSRKEVVKTGEAGAATAPAEVPPSTSEAPSGITFPDDAHAALYTLGQKRQNYRKGGAGMGKLDKLLLSEREKVATALNIPIEDVNAASDDYRRQVEDTGGKVAPKIGEQDDAAWWGGLDQQQRAIALKLAAVFRNPKTPWRNFSDTIRAKLSPLRTAAAAEPTAAPSANPTAEIGQLPAESDVQNVQGSEKAPEIVQKAPEIPAQKPKKPKTPQVEAIPGTAPLGAKKAERDDRPSGPRVIINEVGKDGLTAAERAADQKGKTESATEPEKPVETSTAPHVALATALVDRLKAGKPITAQMLQQEATKAYGGTLAEGKFDRKQTYDALELAVNKHIAATPDLRVDDGNWQRVNDELGKILDNLPTQTVRSEEQQSFQQFSTPPTYAAAAAYVANLRDGDVMLEPSAGTGSLIAASMRPGVSIVANELSDRRAALLKELVGTNGRVFTENAEQLDNILPEDVKPTVVVMNPPFSQTAGRMGDKKQIGVGAAHIEEALKRLESGGRLVALVGRGMTMGAPKFRAWWDKIQAKYAVRANIGVDGQVYAKYGTTFGTRLLVIDKVAPTGDRPVLADVQTVADLMHTLEPIRNGRPAVATAERQPSEPGGVAATEGSQGVAQPVQAPPPDAGVVGTGPGSGGGLAAGSPGRAGTAGGFTAGVGTAERHGLAAVESERGGKPGGPGGRVDEATAASVEPNASGKLPAQRDLQPAGQPELATTASSERVDLEAAAPSEQSAGAITDNLYEAYQPQRVRVRGAKPHPGPLVQSAAMASVEPPQPTYKPSLPQEIIDDGELSLAQLEAVIYAGQAHEKMLPAAEGETARRQGHFIGDGTGVGKGREIAGIILDNWRQGRTKAVWVSEKKPLLEDARRDQSGIRQEPKLIFDASKVQVGKPIEAQKGIAFITYDTLRGGMADQAALARGGFIRKQAVIVNGQGGIVQKVEKGKRGAPGQITVKLDSGDVVTVPMGEVTAAEAAPHKSRIDQIVDWFGKDFDGVVAFDEAHNMANSIAQKGDMGMKEAAAKALAGLALQARLPNARVVYVSATGATEVSNLAYAERLGLWGRGTAFADRNAFIGEVESGGIAAMELIARDMKQLGLYTSRSLSYDGVEYDRVEHTLDAPQREIYDTLAEAWQGVLKNINAALETTGGKNDKNARTAAMSAFWGAHQRFFNQIITSMQMPSVVAAVEKDLAEGRQAVLQLTNTNEASQERAAAKATTAEEIEDLDITPRDALIQLVEKSFPTQQYEEYVDEDGNTKTRAVMDASGKPVENREAVEMREKLVEQVSSVSVPQGPLDMILDHFGIDTVAEVTGRKRRFVMKRDEKGRLRRAEDVRAGSANLTETDAFQNGKKRILVFSEAGGTGRSYHADNTSKSKNARRAHYLVQAGWRADKAVQGFGRTHRTNQATAPIFRLVTTDLQGQKRFISSIARRLAQLGALTKGQRQAGDQGVFSARDNLESQEARLALLQFYTDLLDGRVEGVSVDDFENQTALSLRVKDKSGAVIGIKQNLPPITTFLNRLLSLKIDMQNRVFNAFAARMDRVIAARKEAGILDVGLETIRADKIDKAKEQVVHTSEGTGAETKYVRFTLSNRFVPKEFNDINTDRDFGFADWVKAPKGRVYAALNAPDHTDARTGHIIYRYRLVSPVGEGRLIPRDTIDRSDSAWTRIRGPQAQDLWIAETKAAPEFVTRDLHLITGAILPIWDRLQGSPRVVRLQTDANERFIGRVVPEDSIAATLTALGAEMKGEKVDAGALFTKLMAGGRAKLANGWTLRRALVAGEHRIELKGPASFSEGEQVKKDGLFTERIAFQTRYFVPVEEEEGQRVLTALTQYRPVVSVESGDRPAATDDEQNFGSFAEATVRADFPTRKREIIEKRVGEIVGRIAGLKPRFYDKIGARDVLAQKDIAALEAASAARGRELGDTLLGYYAPDDIAPIIAVALNDPVRGASEALNTAGHESWHHVESYLLTDAERAILSRDMDSIAAVAAKARGWSKEEINRLPEYERTAYAFQRYRAGMEDGFTAPVRRIFAKILRVLRQIAAVLRRRGITTWEDIFEEARSGRTAARAALRTGMAGGLEAALASSPDQATPFYSAVLRAVEGATLKKGTTGHWLGFLKNAPGVKQEELDWIGLGEWLTARGTKPTDPEAAKTWSPSVTRDELAAFVRANQIVVSDVVKGGQDALSEDIDDWKAGKPEFTDDNGSTTTPLTLPGRVQAGNGINILHDETGQVDGYDVFYRGEMVGEQVATFPAAVRDLADAMGQDIAGGTKHSTYQLPGGQNYHELLLTLPSKARNAIDARLEQMFARREAIQNRFDELHRDDSLEALKERQLLAGEEEDLRREYAKLSAQREDNIGLDQFKSSHFDEPNILAHVRFNDRVDAQGKRTLFIEEIQSDWHQKGRRGGYDDPKARAAVEKKLSDAGYPISNEDARLARDDGILTDEEVKALNRGYTPDAPFKTTWPELTLKRMIRWAAENGYDQVAWTPGDVQNVRYESALRQRVKKIEWSAGKAAHRIVTAHQTDSAAATPITFNLDERGLVTRSTIGAAVGQPIEDIVGKEIAKKILELPSGEMFGENMMIGGEGMRGFYDKILVNTANKLGKKFGAKVGEAKLSTTNAEMSDEEKLALINQHGVSTPAFQAARRKNITTAHSLPITPAMRDAAMQGQPLFRAQEKTLASAAERPLIPRTKEQLIDQMRGLPEDKRNILLGVLPLNYLKDLARPNMTAVAEYDHTKHRMDAYRGEKQNAADDRVNQWRKVVMRNPKLGMAISDLMHESTLAQTDPTITTKEERSKPAYADLRAKWTALTPNAKEIYATVRDDLLAQSLELDKVLIENLEKTLAHTVTQAERDFKKTMQGIADRGLKGKEREDAEKRAHANRAITVAKAKYSNKARVTKMRLSFESSRLEGPYFPLGRFGQYFVTVRDVDGTVLNFSRFEHEADRRAFVRDMKGEFPQSTISTGVLEERSQVRSAMDPRLLAEIDALLGKSNIPPEVMDAIWQRYLSTMPDLSIRKRFIHRKGTAGFHRDAQRTFASHMFHAAHQMARLKYGPDLTELVEVAKEQGQAADKPVAGTKLANELQLRHDWVMNPKSAKWATTGTTFGFLWYLGVSPAAAIVNATQTTMLGIPILGARFGVAKSSASITKAYGDFAAGKGHIDRANITGDERRAFKEWHDSGALDRSRAYDLAGVAEEGLAYSPLKARVMAKVAWAFHNVERMNREVTALAAYRLARGAGQSHETAVETASHLTWLTHFDYSASNRPRYLQSGLARVALLFRNYQINVLYRIGRDVQQMFKGESPQARKEAAYQFAGITAMMALHAGVLGTPLIAWVLMPLWGMIFGDDDDPMSKEEQFRRAVKGTLGDQMGTLALDGVPGYAAGVSLTDRIGQPDLWFRGDDREQTAVEWWDGLATEAAGPVYGMGRNIIRGWNVIQDRKGVARGIEIAAPKAVKDIMKAWRYANEGVLNLKGDPIIAKEDLTPWDIIATATGFTPAKVAEQYRANTSKKNMETMLNDRRKALLDEYAGAVFNRDTESLPDIRERIKEFNRVPFNRSVRITPDTIQKSLATRKSLKKRTEGGVIVTNKKMNRDLNKWLPEPAYR